MFLPEIKVWGHKLYTIATPNAYTDIILVIQQKHVHLHEIYRTLTLETWQVMAPA